MKYYLLTFNEDYGDEHDVPALECFTEEEYLKWLETPSGKLIPNFEQDSKVYQEKVATHSLFVEELKKRGLYTKFQKDFTKEELVWFRENKVDYVSSHNVPTRVSSFLQASLGNSGDGFNEKFSDIYLCKEFIEAKYVKVLEVDETFYTFFKKANLSRLSLCNIFDTEEFYDYDEDNSDFSDVDE
jgi:hypothetical protein